MSCIRISSIKSQLLNIWKLLFAESTQKSPQLYQPISQILGIQSDVLPPSHQKMTDSQIEDDEYKSSFIIV
jgi:hypothetical protein